MTEQTNISQPENSNQAHSMQSDHQHDQTLVEDARRATNQAFDALLDFMRAEHESGYLNLYRLVPLASLALGNRIQVGNASRYVYHYAQSQGYDIPSYPLSSSGEIKQFFADEGVKNIPEWYEKIGISAELYSKLTGMTVVAVRGQASLRTLFLLKGDLANNWLEFTTFEESGIAKRVTGYQLATLMQAICQAALAHDVPATTSAKKGKNPPIKVSFELLSL